MITLKTKSDIEKMREAGKILSRTFSILRKNVRAGISADKLNNLAHQAILDMGAQPSFLGYRGYKYATCISRNEEVVHGIPYTGKIFFPGDICSIDVGVYYKGFHVDAARTFIIEYANEEIVNLTQVTSQAFFQGVEQAVCGNKLGDISYAIQNYVESHGFSVVRDLYSHGIGRELHEEPLIPNYGKKNKGISLQIGMTFAIEPMVNIGTYQVLTLPDKWTIITADQKYSAHYENTVYIGEDGCEILTLEEKL